MHPRGRSDVVFLCTRDGRSKKVSTDDTCSYFVSEDANSCFECAYANQGGLLATKAKDYYCKKKGKRINGHDLACHDFEEY